MRAIAWIGPIAWIGWGSLASCGGDVDTSPAQAASRPVPVDVGAAREGSLRDGWRLTGDVRALSRAALAPQVAGQAVRVPVREGDRVQRGDVLLLIDPDVVRAEAEAAEADVEVARAEARRAKAEAERVGRLSAGVVSATDRDLAQAQAEIAQAQVARAEAEAARARAMLARHTLRAPYAGVVGLRRVDPGDHVTAGQAVFDLISDEGTEVVVDGPQELLATVKRGEQGTLFGPGDASASATIAGLVPALDPASRTVRVRLTPDAPPAPWLVPGANVRVTLPFARELDGGVVVPRDALLDGAGDPAVVRLSAEDEADRVLVQVVARNETEALLRGGAIAPGDRVVIRGNERLRSGQRVQIRHEQGAAEMR